MTASSQALVERYNDAWNRHDLAAIAALHTQRMVFENHTAAERAEGPEVAAHIESIFSRWPDLAFVTRRLHACERVAVCEWTARATHLRPVPLPDGIAAPSGRRIEWRGVDVLTIEDGLIARKDVYSDRLGVMRQLGAL
jgi:steroid delta-isomerase-like uncharacterized protein